MAALDVGKEYEENIQLVSEIRLLCKIVCAFLLILTCLFWATLSFQKFGS